MKEGKKNTGKIESQTQIGNEMSSRLKYLGLSMLSPDKTMTFFHQTNYSSLSVSFLMSPASPAI